MSIDWTAIALRSALVAALPASVQQETRTIVLDAGQRLFAQGDPPVAMYFVVAGDLALIRRGCGGEEFVIQRTGFGMLAEASFDQHAYHCEAIARAPTRLLSMPRDRFVEAMASPRFGAAWITHLARELRRSRCHAERLSLRTARDRIRHYIETEGANGSAEITSTLKGWAGELGLTHEALYRALASMRRNGEISIEGQHLALAGAGANSLSGVVP